MLNLMMRLRRLWRLESSSYIYWVPLPTKLPLFVCLFVFVLFLFVCFDFSWGERFSLQDCMIWWHGTRGVRWVQGVPFSLLPPPFLLPPFSLSFSLSLLFSLPLFSLLPPPFPFSLPPFSPLPPPFSPPVPYFVHCIRFRAESLFLCWRCQHHFRVLSPEMTLKS